MSLGPGSMVGRYKILRQLGSGAMGRVFVAREQGGIEIALKVILEELANNREAVSRFFTEARAVTQIGHPNIVEVLDFGQTEDGLHFMAMELLEGIDLRERVKLEQTLRVESALHVAIQISDGLAAAHHLGIIHRDLKPDNIFLIDRGGDSEFVKILDFGLAKLTVGNEDVLHHTRAGTVLGTPHYMAPEQVEGKSVDYRVDIYSLGCILYRMLCGQVPFPGDTYAEVLIKQLRDLPTNPRQLDPSIPPAVEKLVLRALSKSRDARFQTMVELGAAMRAIHQALPKSAAPPARPARPPTGQRPTTPPAAASPTPKPPRLPTAQRPATPPEAAAPTPKPARSPTAQRPAAPPATPTPHPAREPTNQRPAAKPPSATPPPSSASDSQASTEPEMHASVLEEAAKVSKETANKVAEAIARVAEKEAEQAAEAAAIDAAIAAAEKAEQDGKTQMMVEPHPAIEELARARAVAATRQPQRASATAPGLERQLAVRRAKSPALTVLAVGMAVLGAVAIVIALSLKPAPPPPPDQTVAITSQPIGAEVTSAGKSLGKTPVVVKLPAKHGRISYSFRLPGYVETSSELLPEQYHLDVILVPALEPAPDMAPPEQARAGKPAKPTGSSHKEHGSSHKERTGSSPKERTGSSHKERAGSSGESGDDVVIPEQFR